MRDWSGTYYQKGIICNAIADDTSNGPIAYSVEQVERHVS